MWHIPSIFRDTWMIVLYPSPEILRILGDVRDILGWYSGDTLVVLGRYLGGCVPPSTSEYLPNMPRILIDTRPEQSSGCSALDFILEHHQTGLAPSIPEYPPSILRIFRANSEEANPSALRTSRTVPEYTPEYSEPLGPPTYRAV